MGVHNQRITSYRNLDVDETGAVVIATPARISTLIASNVSATTPVFLKIYDKATAATASDTPVFTIPIPPADEAPSTVPIPFAAGREPTFSNGISIRAVTGVADNDNTGAATNTCIVNMTTIENFAYTS